MHAEIQGVLFLENFAEQIFEDVVMTNIHNVFLFLGWFDTSIAVPVYNWYYVCQIKKWFVERIRSDSRNESPSLPCQVKFYDTIWSSERGIQPNSSLCCCRSPAAIAQRCYSALIVNRTIVCFHCCDDRNSGFKCWYLWAGKKDCFSRMGRSLTFRASHIFGLSLFNWIDIFTAS